MRECWKAPFLVAALLGLLAGCTARPDDPLGKAAARGDLSELGRLMRAGALVGARNGALVWAARSGQPDAVSLLVKNGADPNVVSGVNGWPALMHAIHKDQPAAVRALLNNGADGNARGDNGETPMMMAAGYGYTDIVRILLEHGADARATLSNGENALDFALSGMADIDRFTFGHCQSDTVRLLRQSVPDLHPKDSAKLRSCS